MFDVCVIGQIVKDYNYLKGQKYPPKISAGGTGYYSTYTYYNLGLKTALVTSFNKNDKYLLSKQFGNPIFNWSDIINCFLLSIIFISKLFRQ